MAEVRLPTKLMLTIVTRDRKVVETEVDEVVLPGTDGYLGILPGHTPLLAMLGIGIVTYRTGGQEQRLVITWGFAEVLPHRVIVLAEGASLATEIDRAGAERQKLAAEKELAGLAAHDEAFPPAQARLDESVAMIQVSSHH